MRHGQAALSLLLLHASRGAISSESKSKKTTASARSTRCKTASVPTTTLEDCDSVDGDSSTVPRIAASCRRAPHLGNRSPGQSLQLFADAAHSLAQDVSGAQTRTPHRCTDARDHIGGR